MTTLRQAASNRAIEARFAESAETVRRILDVAVRLMVRDAELEPNMRELLAEARISTRAFYRHFPNRSALISTVVEDIYNEMLDHLQGRIAHVENPVQQLAEWVRGVVSYAEVPESVARGRALVLHQARLSRDFADVYIDAGRRLVRQLGGILERGVEAGCFTVADLRSDARLITTLTLAAMQRHVLLSIPPQPQDTDKLIGFILRALGRPVPRETERVQNESDGMSL